jgi:hypothetical protein
MLSALLDGMDGAYKRGFRIRSQFHYEPGLGGKRDFHIIFLPLFSRKIQQQSLIKRYGNPFYMHHPSRPIGQKNTPCHKKTKKMQTHPDGAYKRGFRIRSQFHYEPGLGGKRDFHIIFLPLLKQALKRISGNIT